MVMMIVYVSDTVEELLLSVLPAMYIGRARGRDDKETREQLFVLSHCFPGLFQKRMAEAHPGQHVLSSA